MSAGGTVVEILSLSLREMAAELGVGYATVRAWAAGTRRPDRQNQARLAALARRQGRKLLALARELEYGAGVEAPREADDPFAVRAELQRENRALVNALLRQAQSIRRP